MYMMDFIYQFFGRDRVTVIYWKKGDWKKDCNKFLNKFYIKQERKRVFVEFVHDNSVYQVVLNDVDLDEVKAFLNNISLNLNKI